MARAKRRESRELNRWGEPFEERAGPKVELLPLAFKGRPVRTMAVDGEPEWVLSDVAKVLGYRDATSAGGLLRNRHKGTRFVCTLGGPQEMTVINEPGLYRLMMRSDHPEAEEFQDWITDEVLPAIRKTGGYSLIPSRVQREKKRLGCDFETAIARCEQRDTNKDCWDWLNGRKATPLQRADQNASALMTSPPRRVVRAWKTPSGTAGSST
jgi:prophage antirepressor-like protein